MPDHVHLLAALPPTLAVADFVKGMKLSAHNYLRANAALFPDFNGWGKLYCALTHGMAEKATIIRYIMGQKGRYRQMSFRDELRQMLTENGIGYEEANLRKEWEE